MFLFLVKEGNWNEKKKTEKNYHQYKRCSYYSVSSRCSLIETLPKLQTFLYNLKHLMRFSMLSIEHLMNAFYYYYYKFKFDECQENFFIYSSYMKRDESAFQLTN